MWTRSQLKMNAKEKLRIYYWNGLLVSFIYSFIGGGFGGGVSGFSNAVNGGGTRFAFEDPGFEYTGDIPDVLIVVLLMALLIGLVAGMAFTAFLVNPLAVGVQRYFLMSGEQRTEISEILFAFRKGHYLNIVKIMFLRQLYTILWTFLFIVPGIVKAYEYYMIPYLLAEDPMISTADAFRLTREMTSGEKLNIFVLELSFFGWICLGVMACGIGVIFVMPYMHATFVELYLALKAKIYYRSNPQGGYY